MKYSRLMAAILCVSATAANAELVHQFKNPAFSGIGWSSHVLTIDSVEKSRRDAVESQRKADLATLTSAAQNTPMNRFMNLFTSQVYAQLANQLSSSLFTGCSKTDVNCVAPTNGTANFDGNTINWSKSADGKSVSLKVVDKDGSVTDVTVPLASFAF